MTESGFRDRKGRCHGMLPEIPDLENMDCRFSELGLRTDRERGVPDEILNSTKRRSELQDPGV